MHQHRVHHVVIASHNAGKIQEWRHLLSPFGVKSEQANELGLPEPPETGSDYIANARLKACQAAVACGLPALGDDTGLDILALDGFPGLHTRAFCADAGGAKAAMEVLHEKLIDAGLTSPEERQAIFVCAVALAFPDGFVDSFEGRVQGSLGRPPFGAGPGLWPMFVPAPRGAVLPHRQHAFQGLVRYFQD